ncbi:hypothetical protein ACFL3A_12260, partial [Pseudomonadota bacterium]
VRTCPHASLFATSGDLERTENKLGNASFVDKAPAAVVDKEKAKAEDLRSAITQLEEQLTKIAAL